MGPWDPSIIGPIAGTVMVVGIALSVASVKIFQPLTSQLGELLEQMRMDRKERQRVADPEQIALLMEQMLDRMDRIEERQDFTERVLESAGWREPAAPLLSKSRSSERRGQSGE